MTDIDKLRSIIHKNRNYVTEAETDMFDKIGQMKALSSSIEKLAEQRQLMLTQVAKLEQQLKCLIQSS
ncbi:MAG: hypothetical protein ACPH5P_00245 [Akkermansiaceae bacterium]